MLQYALLFGLVVLFASFTQSVSGFGLAIVATPLFHWLGVSPLLSVPLIALIGLLIRPAQLWHHRAAFNWRDIWRMAAASVVGVPLGLAVFKGSDATTITRLLGGVVLAYSGYTAYLMVRRAPARPLAAGWGWLSGLVSGLLGGAFNIFGPSTVMYLNAQGWDKDRFKANLQAYALLMSVLITGTHLLAGSITPAAIAAAAYSLPFALAGLWAGFWLDQRISLRVFNRLVLALLAISGGSMLVS
jgi:hypothetical protein